jgi:prevent-host-death family protein
MGFWPLHLAKNRLSELINRARSDGPQIITRHGKQECAVITVEELERLQAGVPSLEDLLLQRLPGAEIDLERYIGRRGNSRTPDVP